jgi:hypothetical protein
MHRRPHLPHERVGGATAHRANERDADVHRIRGRRYRAEHERRMGNEHHAEQAGAEADDLGCAEVLLEKDRGQQRREHGIHVLNQRRFAERQMNEREEVAHERGRA